MVLSDTLRWGSRMMRSSATDGDWLRDTFGFDAIVIRDVKEGTFMVVCARCGQRMTVPEAQLAHAKDLRINHECPDVVAKEIELRANRDAVTRQRIAPYG